MEAALAMELPPQVNVEISAVTPFRASVEDCSRMKGGTSLRVRLSYVLQGEARQQMIVKLYTGAYSQEISELDKSVIAGRLWSRAFGRDFEAAT